MSRFYYELDNAGSCYGVWQTGGTMVEDNRQVDTLLFDVVTKVDAQEACELLNNLWKERDDEQK